MRLEAERLLRVVALLIQYIRNPPTSWMEFLYVKGFRSHIGNTPMQSYFNT